MDLGQRKPSNRSDDLEIFLDWFPILRERKNQFAGSLSGGEQQMLTLVRAMLSNPKLILMDEMSIGLSPKMTLQVFQTLKHIRKLGTSILLVEQNANLALTHSDRCYVLEQGRIALEGLSKDLISSNEVKKAYLGL